MPTVPPELKPEQVEQLRRALAQGTERVGVLRQARAEGVLAEELGGSEPVHRLSACAGQVHCRGRREEEEQP